MSHLSIERLAALADEQPTAAEQAHLSACPPCAQEVEAHRSLLAMAGSERDTLGIPLTRWDTLAQRLRTEGLMSADQPGSVTAEWAAPIGKRKLSSKAWMRFAAAVLLMVSGSMIGRASAGASLLPGGLTGDEPARTSALIPNLDAVPTAFASVDDANRFKQYYASGYQAAVSFLAANDSTAQAVETPAVMRARLAALDRVSRTMREALNDAPFDPVLNDFYLNSFGQREATLRQLNTVLPSNVRLNSY
jgi:hypothetical protein